MRKLKKTLALLLAAVLCLTCCFGTAQAVPAGRGALSPAEAPLRVIVRMEGAPTAAASAETRGRTEALLNAQHAAFRKDLKASGVSYALYCEYRTLLNGFALEVPASDLETLAGLPGVRSVHVANRYAPPETVQMESSNDMTGAAWMHQSEYRGSGTVIAVLDTGITPGHEAFGVYDGMLSQAKLSVSEAEAKIASFGYGAYLSDKIPFAYDYSDLDDDATDEISGHGTHVAGIAAGFACGAEGEIRFCGTAPDAQLLAMKIFSSKGDGGTDSAIYLKALEDAYLLGADVINLSIGAPSGFSWDQELEDEVFGNIYQTLRECGVAVSVAAGNEGSMAEGASNWAGSGCVTADYADYGVLSSPASYGGNLAAASAENAAFPVHVLRAAERSIRYYDADDQFFDAFYQPGEPPVEYAVVPRFGEPGDYAGLLIAGKLALVSRGGITFQEKLSAAAAAGAAGLLVYNNEPGELYMSISDYAIPAAAISQEDGEYLISLAETVAPPAEPAPSDESGEDLGTFYCRVNSQEACVSGGTYLIVSEQAGKAFNAGAQNVNSPGNGIPVTITAGYFPATEELHGAEMRLEAECLMSGRGYLSCGGTVDEVRFDDSPEELTIIVDSGGKAEISCKNCSFRYRQNEDVFRFYLPNSPVLQEPGAAVSLYKLGAAPAFFPTQIGTLCFPEEQEAFENPKGWQPSGFSSMGVTPELELKPSLTGVGGNVCSALFGTEDGYAVWSGTSMAAPNVSGAVACLLQYLRETRPGLDACARMELAEALLMSTAKVLTDDEGRVASPRKQGAGLIDLEAAAKARAVITEPVLSLGDSETGAFSLTFDVRSLCSETLTYSLDLTALRDLCKDLDPDGDGETDGSYNTLRSRNVSKQVSIRGDRTVVVPPGETVSVELQLVLKDELLTALREDFPNGAWLDGYISLSEPTKACSGGETCPGHAMKDMPKPSSWAHPGIDFVISRNLFSGMTPTSFKPGSTMTRAMMVTVLYSLAGKPAPKGENQFTDVKPNKYYTKAVTWASENGIVSGVGNGRFNPNANVTREQMAIFFQKYAVYAGVDTDVEADIKGYPDYNRVHGYAIPAMRWAVGAGVLSGVKTSDGTILDPRGNATRAQVARMFMSFVLNCIEPPLKTGELHVSFTGFFGDWAAAPILEQHDWREIVDLQNQLETEEAEPGISYADLGVSYLDAADFEVNTDVNLAWAVSNSMLTEGEGDAVYLGDNPFGHVAYSADRAAISPTGVFNAVWMEPMLLRNARHLIMTAVDAETGELYAVDDTEYLPKAYWDAEAGAWQSTGLFLYDGTDRSGKALPGGTMVDIRFYADLAWGEDALGALDYEDLREQGSEWLVWSFSLTVDDAAPEFKNLSWDPTTHELTFDISDDQYLSLVELTPLPLIEEDEQVYYDPIISYAFSDEEPGGFYTIELTYAEYGEYTLSVWDYAGNETLVRLSLDSSPTLHELRFICPENCAPLEADRWYVSQKAFVTMPTMKGEVEEGDFCGWLPEPLEGYWTAEALEDASLYEEICWKNEKAQIWGDTWFYALFESENGYYTAQD